MSHKLDGVEEAKPQFVRRSTTFNGSSSGFGRVHASRNGTTTICGKLMDGEWNLYAKLIELEKEKATYSSLAVFCDVCRDIKNATNPSKVQEVDLSKKKSDYQKDLLPMWDGKAKSSSPSSQTGFTYSGNTCSHTGTKVACILERGISLAGAKGSSIDFEAADVVIDCAGMTKKDFNAPSGGVVSGTARLVDAVKETITHPDTLFIDWPDMQVPRVGPKFWVALLAAIPDNSRVVACCMGSHGRTGTALSCLIAANSLTIGRENVPDAVDIIKFVRKNHCEKAVETQSQEDYIARIVANFKDPGNQDEVKRQWALNDAAFKKPSGVAKVYPKVETQGPQSAAVSQPSQAVSQSSEVVALVPQKEEKKYEWVDYIGADPQEAELVAVGGDDDIMFLDAAGNVVNESGEIVFEKGKLSAEERDWSMELPTWSEYIQQRYEKGQETALKPNADGGKDGN